MTNIYGPNVLIVVKDNDEIEILDKTERTINSFKVEDDSDYHCTYSHIFTFKESERKTLFINQWDPETGLQQHSKEITEFPSIGRLDLQPNLQHFIRRLKFIGFSKDKILWMVEYLHQDVHRNVCDLFIYNTITKENKAIAHPNFQLRNYANLFAMDEEKLVYFDFNGELIIWNYHKDGCPYKHERIVSEVFRNYPFHRINSVQIDRERLFVLMDGCGKYESEGLTIPFFLYIYHLNLKTGIVFSPSGIDSGSFRAGSKLAIIPPNIYAVGGRGNLFYKFTFPECNTANTHLPYGKIDFIKGFHVTLQNGTADSLRNKLLKFAQRYPLSSPAMVLFVFLFGVTGYKVLKNCVGLMRLSGKSKKKFIVMRLFIFSLGVLTFMFSTMNVYANTSEKKPRIGIGCVVQKDGKVLLGQRKGAHAVSYWGFPGGHLEFGESVEECAARELLEETGLKPLSVRLGPWVENLMEDGQKHYITLFVFIDSFVGEPELLEPEKCVGWSWFSWEDLPSPLFSPIPSLIQKEINLSLK